MTHKNSHNDLTPKFIREIFHYDPTTGLLTWKKQLSFRAPVGKTAGAVGDKARIKIGIRGKDYFAHRIAWVWMTGKWPKYEIDHADENQSNNRWNNLREATPSQNHRNRGKQRNNTTGYKGVCFDKRAKRFVAGIKLNGRRHNL